MGDPKDVGGLSVEVEIHCILIETRASVIPALDTVRSTVKQLAREGARLASCV
jgi:hypothetical protein